MARRAEINFILMISADKKAVKVLRGCSPGCPWCTCGREKRLASAWPLDRAPTTWKEAEALLAKICTGAFPDIFDACSWAHLALPFEKISRRCTHCGKKPYKTEAEYQAALKHTAAMRADTSKEGRAN